MDSIRYVLLCIVAIMILVGGVAFLAFFRIWIRALAANAKISVTRLVAMRLRKVNMNTVVDSRIMAVKGGLDVSLDQLETHYLAGGNVTGVVQSLIAADRANIDFSFEESTAIDLQGRNVLEEVQAIAVKQIAQG